MSAQFRFNAGIIGDLRARAVAHNRVVGDGEATIRLGDLKGLYKKFHSGRNPHNHALAKIDEFLARKQAGELLKATRPFESGEHPRGGGGRFRDTGGSGEHDRQLLDAASTQVIPETRFSVLGPPIAGAAGVALGAGVGATATLRGSATDRLATSALRAAGGKIGEFGGRAIGGAGVSLPRTVARAAIPRLNRRLGTRIPRPDPAAGDKVVTALRVGGKRVGRISGAALGHGSALMVNAPAALARNLARGRFPAGSVKGRAAAAAAGALVGAVWPGAFVYGPALSRYQAAVGPYEDTLLPRRVKKIADLLNDPLVLQKQAEILGSDLAKADLGTLGRALLAAARRGRAIVGQGKTRATVLDQMGPLGPSEEAARQAFAARRAQFTVPRRIGGHALVVAQRGAAGSVIGAGAGAISGASLASFDQKHPRGEHGRFRRKPSEAAKHGALVGGAIGLGLGAVAGLAAARGGQTATLNAALDRLTATGPDTLPQQMREQARKIAQSSHAHAYRSANAHLIPAFTGSGREPDQVASSLAQHAIARWMQNEGQAIQAGAKAWYTYQIDRAFDQQARSKLWALGRVLGADDKPLSRNTANLINNIAPDKLEPGQRKIWDDLVARRQRVIGEVDQVYAERSTRTKELVDTMTHAKTEKAALERAQQAVPDRWDDMKEDAALREIKTFAKERLGHDVQARTRDAAVAEVDQRLPVWQHETDVRLSRLAEEIAPENQAFIDAARSAEHADLTQQEAGAIVNPFSTGKDRFLRNRPAGAEDSAGFQKIRAAIGERAAKPFREESEAHGDAAENYLHSLIVAQETALRARVPTTGLTAKAFHRVAPMVAGHMHQAAIDASAMMDARRASLVGVQKQVADWLYQHRDPVKAGQTAKALALGGVAGGKKVGKFGLAHWKLIASLLGPLLAGGVIDISGKGKLINFDPKKWNRPKNLAIVHEWPDVIRRPHEALFGVSYQSPDGRRRFLHGVHIHSANGDFHDIPFGTEVDQVLGAIKGQNNNRANVEQVKVQNPKVVDDTISALEKQGNIRTAGPAGFEFKQREGGSADTAQNDYRNSFYTEHLKFLEQVKGASTNKEGRYFASLVALFDDPRSSVLDLATRAHLLVGNHQPVERGGKRGIFANHGNVFVSPGSADKAAVTEELRKQLQTHKANNEEKYAVLRQAMWAVGQYYGMSEVQQASLVRELDKHYEAANPGTSAPAGAAPLKEPIDLTADSLDAERGRSHGEAFAHYLSGVVPPQNRPGHMRDDDKFRAHVAAIYDSNYRLALKNNSHFSEGQAKGRAQTDTRAALRMAGVTLEKMAKVAGAAARPPRIKIKDAAEMKPGADAMPQITGAGSHTPRVGTQVRQAAQPAHALSQIGGYAAGQGAYRAAHFLTGNATADFIQNAVPGGRVLGPIARFAVPAAASVFGYNAGTKTGASAGRAIGGAARMRPQGAGEMLAHAAGGLVGSMAGEAAGAALGSVVPVGGTIAGGIAGAGLGGYLGDEGAGIIYNALAHYGAHMPAKVMGPHLAARAAARQKPRMGPVT